MFWTRHHLSDQELLLAADSELSARRLRRVHAHLGICSTCRIRLDVIQETLADVSRACHEHANPRFPAAEPARAQLKIRLTELSGRQGGRAIAHLRLVSAQRRWLYAVGTLVLSASGLFLYGRSVDYRVHDSSSSSRVFLLPIAALTPGATRPVTVSKLCSGISHAPAAVIPASVHQDVFRNYGTDYRRAAEYELDHLITPELGGASDARNLWPQPYSQTPWNAYVKDELERLFHRLVCHREIDLATAQRAMATDWIWAYKQYFHTDKPLRDYDSAPLTVLDSELLLGELEELGVSPPVRANGSALMAMLQAARMESLSR